MSQDTRRIELATSPGYLIKVASSALRTAMEDVLRPLNMTITHYSCLELLSHTPGMSSSDLARGTFVTRQSMNVLLQSLVRDGLVSRPAQAASGRVLPTELTDAGRAQLATASAAVRAVEDRMVTDLDAADVRQLTDLLRRCVASLGMRDPLAPADGAGADDRP